MVFSEDMHQFGPHVRTSPREPKSGANNTRQVSLCWRKPVPNAPESVQLVLESMPDRKRRPLGPPKRKSFEKKQKKRLELATSRMLPRT